MHFVELSKIDLEQGDTALARWMRFLLVRNEEELEEVAMSDSNIRRAVEALKSLSQDPAAQELARQRELAQINLKIMRQFEYETGEAKGRVEGRVEGRAESLRLAIETAADLLGIEISDARRESIDVLDADGLTVLLGVLREERRWPGGG